MDGIDQEEFDDSSRGGSEDEENEGEDDEELQPTQISQTTATQSTREQQQQQPPFFCCYLLTGTQPRTRKRTYIGFSVDPRRRLRQHNGEVKGGARRTARCKGSWKMVLFVFGFPSKVAALRFEWAWQHPWLSRCLKDARAKEEGSQAAAGKRVRRNSPQQLPQALATVMTMLNTPPWQSLPLHLCWLDADVESWWQQQRQKQQGARSRTKATAASQQAAHPSIPQHMAQFSLPGGWENVASRSLDDLFLYAGGTRERRPVVDAHQHEVHEQPASTEQCCVCREAMAPADSHVENHVTLRCMAPSCSMVAHPICLASAHSKTRQPGPVSLVPVEVACPVCECRLPWGELVRNAHRRLSQISFAEDTWIHAVPSSQTQDLFSKWMT
ncbi:GIY-YIG domain-containing protein 1 [Salpingoeca rosetta]|uniref:Structure-specific endonuclease subunit SLX1 homolog n=1 Tax=Salpingoeca rosetta (strain ATCC 50818 / BSB-021) TaxID=946362 RepID=F2TZ46_SALR5|nr:GIY-YIG domain-containing protein 1 [Salpingoeca rosetta]EGD78870.1 GIY-YIG domain-containing protein 1 [Salpingoeca rosetta]|eukprot:XP_004997826.1 GIY-YIG domain-containing protein 1 [Salpingoeca rosetta]